MPLLLSAVENRLVNGSGGEIFPGTCLACSETTSRDHPSRSVGEGKKIKNREQRRKKMTEIVAFLPKQCEAGEFKKTKAIASLEQRRLGLIPFRMIKKG